MAKQKYTLRDLEWLREKLITLKKYIEANPVDKLNDRTTVAMSAKGTPVIKLVASKEVQLTALLKAHKEILLMLGDLERLEEEKVLAEMEVRGGGEINGLMRTKLAQQ